MVVSLAPHVRVFLACQPTDMRKAIDGSSVMVQHQFDRDPFTVTCSCSSTDEPTG